MLACIIPSMFMSPDSLPQACRGSLGMNYEASLLVSLKGREAKWSNPKSCTGNGKNRTNMQ